MLSSKKATLEFEKATAKGWETGVTLNELLSRVNLVAGHLLPAPDERDSRISASFLPRTFRHYVTLGVISPAWRDGRRATYGRRHFLQALLVRRLLAQGVPARRMPELVSGSGDDDLRRMILDGVEILVQPGGDAGPAAKPREIAGTTEHWCRIQIAPGVELHINADLPKLKRASVDDLSRRIKEALSDDFQGMQ